MAARPKRARTVRRERARQDVSDARDRERLFRLEPGGSAECPIDVASASVVERRAATFPCPLCGGEHAIDEHAAVSGAGQRLREVRLRCHRCGTRRSLWFRLPSLN
jgi:predicted RNA-binding Zn-ribbon protein involved in translation (DUF1610 family)